MSDICEATIRGRVCEIKTRNRVNKKPVTRFQVAVMTRELTSGIARKQFFRVATSGQLALECAQLKLGTRVEVTGEFSIHHSQSGIDFGKIERINIEASSVSIAAPGT